MSFSRSVMKTLVFFICSLHLSSSVSHSLQYFYTGVSPGINFPEFTLVGLVDGGQFVYYDSKIEKMIPKTEWIKKNEGEDYWNTETQNQQGWQESFKVGVGILMNRFNQTGGVHTWQTMCGCERDDDGTVRGYFQYGYDGEDFVSFDLKTQTWIAPTPQALITKNKWDNDPGLNTNRKNYLEKECIEWVQKYVTYGRETLERKDPPTSSVFQKHSPSPEVVCHATGFFPKELMISWRKDEVEMNEDVEFRETIPNQDGSFQKRIILKVPAEDLQKHKYTCVIQHSSLKEEMVLDVNKQQITEDNVYKWSAVEWILIFGPVVILIALSLAGFLIWIERKKVSHVPVQVDSSVSSSLVKSSHVPEEMTEREEEIELKMEPIVV